MSTFTPSTNDSRPLRNNRRERYCIAVASGMTKRESIAVAGYATKAPSQTIYQLHKSDEVRSRIVALQKQAAAAAISITSVTREEVIQSLRARRLRAQEGTPILAKDGSPTGDTREDFSAGNRSDEILAKMHGFMLDVHREESLDEELDGKSPEELKVYILSLLEQVDPNMHKKLQATIHAEESVIEVVQVPPPGTMQ